MKKPAVSHHGAHKSPLGRVCAGWPRVGVRLSASPRLATGSTGGQAGGMPGKRPPLDRVGCRPRRALNWSLRRYVLASSLSVWLRRQPLGAAGASGPANRGGPRCASGRRTGAALEAGPLASGERVNGVSRPAAHALRYRIHRNRQMEHLTQVAASLRGGVRRGSAITPREHAGARDLLSTTLSSKTCVQSNIFGFVMT
jgi:hypothetical protein